MRRIGLAMLAAWLAWPVAVSAHDVPDLVNVAVFFKPENGRLQMLVRVPSNAFIDCQFPVLDATWLDLSESEAIAAEAVKVWVADRLSLFENGLALPKPTIVTTRISRMNDPFFGSFDDALIHGNLGMVHDPSRRTERYRFSIRAHGRHCKRGNHDRSRANGTRGNGSAAWKRYFIAMRHGRMEGFLACSPVYARKGWYLEDLLRRPDAVNGATEALVLAAIEAFTLMACVRWTPSAPWIPPLCGALTAAAVAYLGTEAIVGGDGRRMGLGVGAGLIFGASFWSGVQPLLQYAGEHPLAAGFGFAVGVVVSQLIALALAVALVKGALMLSRAPRAIVIITAAVVIHISWRRMMDRTGALTLVPFDLPRYSGSVVFAGLWVLGLLSLAFAYFGRRQSRSENRPAV